METSIVVNPCYQTRNAPRTDRPVLFAGDTNDLLNRRDAANLKRLTAAHLAGKHDGSAHMECPDCMQEALDAIDGIL